MKYTVKISEIFSESFVVEANSPEEAEKKAFIAHIDGNVYIRNDGPFEIETSCVGESSEIDLEMLSSLDDMEEMKENG